MNLKHWLYAIITLIIFLVGCNIQRPSTPPPTPTPVPATGEDDVPRVEVPAGEFVMGTSLEDLVRLSWEYYEGGGRDNLAFSDEEPQHLVTLPAFKIDQLEVTNGRYRRCVEAGVCPPVVMPRFVSLPTDEDRVYITDPGYNNYPVFVTGVAAQTYCQGVGKRLPTEAEWEKAARGPDGRFYPWGNEWDSSRVALKLAPVGDHPSDISPYGVLDMAGNAEEWTGTQYSLYPGIEQFHPTLYRHLFEPSYFAGEERPPLIEIGDWVVRGGVPRWPAKYSSRVVMRWYRDPQSEQELAGFRCVAGPEPIPLEEAIVRMLEPTPTPTLSP